MLSTYPEHKAVYLLKKKTYRLTQEDERWFIYEDYHTEVLHLREGSADWADDHITYSQFSEITSFNAYTLVPTEDRHVVKPFAHFSDHDWVQEDVFYDDTRVRRFLLSQIRPGAITVLRYTRKIKDAHLWGGFFFTAPLPVEQAELRVEFPSEVEVIPAAFNMDTLDISSEQSSQHFGWKAHRLPAQPLGVPKAPPLRLTEPHILFRIGSQRDSTGTRTVFLQDYQDLYSWYYPFIEPINKRKSWGLEKLVSQITAETDTPAQKARKLFGWVQEHIRYLAFEEGWSGFIPETPDQVCQKGYGDCKSMSSLLVGLFRTAGIPAYFAWVGSRALPYTYDDLPTPLADNHMMVMTVVEGDTLWLDATSPYRAFGKAASFAQGKEALIALKADSCGIREIPVQPSSYNQIQDSCHFHLQENTLRGRGVIRFSGYAKTLVAEMLQEHLPANLHKVLPKLLQYEHKTLRILQAQMENLDGSDKPLEIRYVVELKNYYHKFRNEIYINPHIAPIWKEKFIAANRSLAWVNAYNFRQDRLYTFHIPEGFRANDLIADKTLRLPDFGYDFRYRLEGRQIKVHQHLYNHRLDILPRQFEDWNRLIASITSTYQENIRLVR